MFKTPTIHGIEFTWEKVKKKLDLDGCGPLNATGKVMIFHTDLRQSKTKQLRLVWTSAFDNETLAGEKAEKLRAITDWKSFFGCFS